jgi:Arc/MetJ family transcription regulator
VPADLAISAVRFLLSHTPISANLGIHYEKETLMGKINIDLDDNLIDEAMKLTNKKTKKELVNYAVEELVQTQEKKILELEGKVEWEGNLDDLRKSRVSPRVHL